MESEEAPTWESPKRVISTVDQVIRQQAQARPLVLLLMVMLVGFLLGRRNR